MSITSLEFVFFFLIVLVVYCVIPKKHRWYALLAASLGFFYFASGWQAMPWLALGIVTTYLAAYAIERCQNERVRKIILVFTIVVVLGELFAFKCLQNFAILFSKFFAIQRRLYIPSILIPIGISYYSLSAIGYVIDVYRGTCPAQRNPLKHALYVAYFLQMISGPFVRAGEMIPQLYSGNSVRYSGVVNGAERMLWGYFKKLVVADRLGVVVATVYGDTAMYPGIYVIFATVCYAFQLYADFSGCMDIVLGASECFGIKLPENFRAPFFSTTISEFWRRWHITLGLWFKDYLLYPLLKSNLFQNIGSWSRRVFGKRRGRILPTSLGLAVVWISIGLWHGGTMNYMVGSGILPGFFLIMSEIMRPAFDRFNAVLHIKTDSIGHRIWGCARTFLLMCICFVFVRAGGIRVSLGAFASAAAIFDFSNLNILHLMDGSLLQLGQSTLDVVLCLGGILLILLVDYIKEKGHDVRALLNGQGFVFRMIVIWALALSIMFFGMFGQSQFIYFQF